MNKYDDASDLAKLAATDLSTYFQGLLNKLETEKTNNLYIGIGGGVVLGVVVGVGISYFMTRRKEIAAVKA